MRVGLMNLGDATRVFFNKLNRQVIVPVGRVVNADLDARVVENIRFSKRPETILICEPDAKVPDELQAVVDLLEVLDLESDQELVNRFHRVLPANNFDTMHPSRAQIRHAIRMHVEDYVAHAHGLEQKQQVQDDVNPEILERELHEQEMNEPPPMHPLQRQKYEEMLAAGVIERPSESPRSSATLEADLTPAPARKGKKAKRK